MCKILIEVSDISYLLHKVMFYLKFLYLIKRSNTKKFFRQNFRMFFNARHLTFNISSTKHPNNRSAIKIYEKDI